MLSSAQFRTPTKICVHGFVTVNGKKMSKSRGTFINARCYLDHLNPEYCATTMPPSSPARWKMIDLNLEDFQQKVNSDLVGKVVNIASRCAKFITKGNDGMLSSTIENRNSGIRSVARQSLLQTTTKTVTLARRSGKLWPRPTPPMNISPPKSRGS